MPEILGAGAALFDADNDGDLDLYMVQGHALEGPSMLDAPRSGDRYFRNQLIETGRLQFVEQTVEAGFGSDGYGVGTAVTDFDHDGDLDLLVTQLGRNLLWRNEGGGTFTEVGGAVGLHDEAWSTTAVFFDYNKDGWADLFVGNYVNFAPELHKDCFADVGTRDYCGPLSHPASPDRLYRNRGDGSFEDVTVESGLANGKHAAALGVLTQDFNQDGWLDLYVSNDAYANRLWINQGDGRFVDDALLAGVALNADGGAEGSMGVDAGDYDGDGLDDLVVTNVRLETHTLYRAIGQAAFVDAGGESGVDQFTRADTGFGIAFIDYDLDGWLDLLIANGAVRLMPGQPQRGLAAYAERLQLLRNLGNARFADVSERAGGAFAEARVGRGMAVGDLDNDGDIDAVVSNSGAPAWVLINQHDAASNWLGVTLLDEGRWAPGTRAGLHLADGRVLWRRQRADGSFAASNDPRLVFGLGATGAVRRLEIVWPDGQREHIDGASLKLGDYQVIQRKRLQESL